MITERFSTYTLLQIVFCLLASSYGFADERIDEASGGQESFFDLPLEDVLDIPVTVASKVETPLRSAPGVVAVLTREEIENSGARDLIDLLSLLPGVQFGIDLQGVVSIGIRGLWATEGKVLLLWNEHEINEIMYDLLQFGRHYPVDEIERIEMIRGPGSVLYGGSAELAVIKVITRGAKDLDGWVATSSVGATDESLSNVNGNVMYGKEFEDVSVRGSVYYGRAIRGDGDYTDIYGSTIDLDEDSKLEPYMANLDIEAGGLGLSFLMDKYDTRQRDEFDAVISDDAINNFTRYSFIGKYDFEPVEGLTVTPKYSYKWQNPWRQYPLEAEDNFVLDVEGQQHTLDLIGLYDISESVEILGGAQYYIKKGKDNLANSFPGGDDEMDVWDYSFFTEAAYKHEDWAVLRAGARFDDHEEFDSQVVPRVALTTTFDRFHVKLLAAKAFRTPGLQPISLNQTAREIGEVIDGAPLQALEPEETTTYEVEVGYLISDTVAATVNLFDTQIDDPVVYFFNTETENELYFNEDGAGTRGVETSLRWQENWGYFDINYSYYTSTDNGIPSYRVEGHSNDRLGFARHTVAGRASFKVAEGLRLNPTIHYVGSRFGYETVDETETSVLSKIDPSLRTNLHLLWEVEQVDGLKLDFGINNVTDEDFEYVQPLDNYHAPFGLMGREYTAKVIYEF